MSLPVRLALLITLIVGTTLFFTWLLTTQAVFRPFRKQMIEAHINHVLHIAQEVENGTPEEQLSQKLGLDIKRRRRPPRFRRRKRCRELERGGRELVICPGRRAPVAVSLDSGWLIVRRDLDVDGPGKKFQRLLALIAVVIILLSGYVAVLVLKPLRASITAMNKMAGGDLSWRLPENGSREQKETARAFNAMADRVASVLRAERELMAGISHELRTPLARLRLETELLKDRGLPEKRLDAMNDDLAEIDRLIGELFEISRLSLGERKLTRSSFLLSELVDEALERWPLPKHHVLVEHEELGAQRLDADREKLVRVLGNLLQNAGKYAPEDTLIRIRLLPMGLEVCDEGPGVTPEALPRLFEPFFRTKRVQSSSATGLGLGLMLARQIVELHNGKIWAKNGEKEGLIIGFSLPG